MEEKAIEAVRKLRENAIIEIALENKELLSTLEKYLCVSVYNKIKGLDSTINNLVKESTTGKELKSVMNRFEPAIKARTFQLIEMYTK